MIDVGAYEVAGRAAWLNGRSRIAPPVAPGSIFEAFVDAPVGSGYAEAAAAWYRGWDAANLSAPVGD